MWIKSSTSDKCEKVKKVKYYTKVKDVEDKQSLKWDKIKDRHEFIYI